MSSKPCNKYEEDLIKWSNDVYNALLRNDYDELSKLFEFDDFTFEDMGRALTNSHNDMSTDICNFIGASRWARCTWKTEGVSEKTQQFVHDHIIKTWERVEASKKKSCRCPCDCEH